MGRRKMTSTWVNLPDPIGQPLEIRHPVGDPPLSVTIEGKVYPIEEIRVPVISFSDFEKIQNG